MKKVLALLIVLILCLTTVNSIYAVEKRENQIYSFCVSELDTYFDLVEKTDEELLAIGISPEDINYLRSISLEKYFSDLKKCTIKSLRTMGYTSYQIGLIKSYNGEKITRKSKMMAASATVNGYMSYISTPSVYSIRYRYSWSWTGVPVFGNKDMMSTAWIGLDSAGYTLNVSPSNISCSVSYYSTTSGAYKYDSSVSTVTATGFNGKNASFYVREPYDDPSDGTSYVYTKNGRMTLTLTSDGTTQLAAIKVGGAYGHAQWTIGVSISASCNTSSGSVGISFSPTPAVTTLAVKTYKITATGIMTQI